MFICLLDKARTSARISIISGARPLHSLGCTALRNTVIVEVKSNFIKFHNDAKDYEEGLKYTALSNVQVLLRGFF
jgi:hypothetical protein